MAANAVVAAPGTPVTEMVITSLPLGTETIAATVTAGTIAVIIDSTVDTKQSGIIDALINKMADVLREQGYT